nr:ribonuclease H-like domain-containing protein [Tanacetum cinerariifolium]
MAYKLYSLDNKTVIFSRDAKFYETIFPSKMQSVSNNDCVTNDTSTEVDWLNFFDTKSSQSPYDEEGDSSTEDGSAGAATIQNKGLVPLETQIEDNVTSKGNSPKFSIGGGSGLRDKGCITDRGSKWIYRIKYKASGEINIYKASAFLYGDIDEEVYMALPLSFYDKNETKVCKLVKSLYGLKQAPRQWNAKLTSALIENGFIENKNDYTLYVKSKKGLFVALLVYVDDIVVTGNDLSEIESFKSSKFMTKNLGELKYFFGN